MDQINDTAIKGITSFFKCPKNFKCYKSGLENLCKAKQTEGAVSYLECLEENPQECIFSNLLQDWNLYVCSCPLRIYMADKSKK